MYRRYCSYMVLLIVVIFADHREHSESEIYMMCEKIIIILERKYTHYEKISHTPCNRPDTCSLQRN